jgi:hypothetical protein
MSAGEETGRVLGIEEIETGRPWGLGRWKQAEPQVSSTSQPYLPDKFQASEMSQNQVYDIRGMTVRSDLSRPTLTLLS